MKEIIRKMLMSRTKALTLFMWMLCEADDDGCVVTSIRRMATDTGLSVREVRSAIAWCVSDTLCDTASDTRMTHVTIRNIDRYKVFLKTSDTASDTVTDTLKDKETEKDKRPSPIPTPLYPIEKEKDKEKESLSIQTRARKFVPPTVEEVRAYITEKGWTIDAEAWWNFYNAKNWMIGKNKMSKWKSAVATWKNRNQNQFKHEEIGQVYRQSETKYTEGW